MMGINLACPKCSETFNIKSNKYFCRNQHHFDIVNQIPRFTINDNYALSFGIQWNRYPKTQLDSFTKTDYSMARLERIVGNLQVFNGRKVLEVGCGAGRFTELMLKAGAKLFAMDLSNAVEANRLNNIGISGNYFVCQGDILEPPILPEQFEIVICLGVVQHTPNPKNTIKALFKQIAPGGTLFIDSYSHEYPLTISRKILRNLLLKLPENFRFPIVKIIVFGGWPIHVLLWKISKVTVLRANRLFRKARYLFLKVSPIIDYHDSYIMLGPKLLKEWAILDTHDNLTDAYKHLTNSSDFFNLLAEVGFTEIKVVSGGNGLEASAKKPR